MLVVAFRKVMNGYYNNRQLISEADMFLWQSRGDQKAETENQLVSAQDWALRSKYHATKILQRESDSKCRVSKQLGEATDHIILYQHVQYWQQNST
jgi:N-acetylmuramoyl-L-alanine amidase CwlA